MSDLTEDEIAALTEIAGLIIPASAAHGVPGADDPAIMAGIIASANRNTETTRRALTAFAASDTAEAFKRDYRAEAAHLQAITAFSYYRDRRVLASLAAEARPPFPKGYEVEQGEFVGLERVKARGPIWRRPDGA